MKNTFFEYYTKLLKESSSEKKKNYVIPLIIVKSVLEQNHEDIELVKEIQSHIFSKSNIMTRNTNIGERNAYFTNIDKDRIKARGEKILKTVEELRMVGIVITKIIEANAGKLISESCANALLAYFLQIKTPKYATALEWWNNNNDSQINTDNIKNFNLVIEIKFIWLQRVNNRYSQETGSKKNGKQECHRIPRKLAVIITMTHFNDMTVKNIANVHGDNRLQDSKYNQNHTKWEDGIFNKHPTNTKLSSEECKRVSVWKRAIQRQQTKGVLLTEHRMKVYKNVENLKAFEVEKEDLEVSTEEVAYPETPNLTEEDITTLIEDEDEQDKKEVKGDLRLLLDTKNAKFLSDFISGLNMDHDLDNVTKQLAATKIY